MNALDFGGHEFRVPVEKALFWPARKALVVADLHLEKGSWFAARGQMLPPHDTLATLDRLGALIERSGAEELWCLGDSFHDSDGPHRMNDDASRKLEALTAAVRWHWITGNHDEALPDGIGGTRLAEAEVDGLILRHRADPEERRPELSGHYHPKHRAAARGRSLSRPCFVMSASKMILPAFGAFTGGLSSDHPEIRGAIGAHASALVPTANQLLRFALPR